MQRRPYFRSSSTPSGYLHRLPSYKQSGMGRELGSYALENYTQVKTVLWDYSDKSEHN